MPQLELPRYINKTDSRNYINIISKQPLEAKLQVQTIFPTHWASDTTLEDPT